jgi:RND family efflux transporter MFP subunit
MELVLHKTKKITISFLSLLRKFWYLVLIVLAIGGYFIYQNQQAQASKKEVTYTVTRETLQDVLVLSGKVDADEKVSLRFQSGGRLAWVGVKEGDVVKQYQGIASLDQRQLEKSLQKYLNTFSRERADFDQSLDDNDTLTIDLKQEVRDRAKRTLDQSQLDLNNTILDVELQTLAKEYAYLYSPIDGIITHVGAPAAGMNVAITDTFDVINPDTIFFALSADQTEVVRLGEGMLAKITLDAYPDEQIAGSITSIAFTPTTSETGTVYEVKMGISGLQNMKYRLGMTGDAEFILKEIPNVVAIPFEYIIDENDKQYVNKKLNGKKVKIEIKTGNEYDGLVQVTDGLYAGDVIYEVTN